MACCVVIRVDITCGDNDAASSLRVFVTGAGCPNITHTGYQFHNN